MKDKDKELIEASNPLYSKKRKEKVKLATSFEWIITDCLTLAMNGEDLEVAVIFKFAEQANLDDLWLLRWVKASYNNYMGLVNG